jgi:hypothetical protein
VSTDESIEHKEGTARRSQKNDIDGRTSDRSATHQLFFPRPKAEKAGGEVEQKEEKEGWCAAFRLALEIGGDRCRVLLSTEGCKREANLEVEAGR